MKERITVSIDKESLAWVDANIENKTFANRSHAFEFLIMRQKTIDEQKQKAQEGNLGKQEGGDMKEIKAKIPEKRKEK